MTFFVVFRSFIWRERYFFVPLQRKMILSYEKVIVYSALRNCLTIRKRC